MGAGQIGGLATLLDIDFHNVQGFVGVDASNAEANYIFYYLSSAMLFCTGALIETHIAVSAAPCVFGERNKFPVVAGTHRFAEGGVTRRVNNFCVHHGYNTTLRWGLKCSTYNIAILLLETPYQMMSIEPGSTYVISRLRYGNPLEREKDGRAVGCVYYGWGSRRSGMMIPMLLNLRRVEVVVLKNSLCDKLWNTADNYLCILMHQCKSDKYGALCPDDLGTVLDCDGWLQGVMVSRLIDRPCGVGFADTTKEFKFLTCATDDGRDVEIGRELSIPLDFMQDDKNDLPQLTTKYEPINQVSKIIDDNGDVKVVTDKVDDIKVEQKLEDGKETGIKIQEAPVELHGESPGESPPELPPKSPPDPLPESPQEPPPESPLDSPPESPQEPPPESPLDSPPESPQEPPPESPGDSPREQQPSDGDKTKKRTYEENPFSDGNKIKKKKKSKIYK